MKKEEGHARYPLHINSFCKNLLPRGAAKSYSLHHLSLIFVSEGTLLLRSGKNETSMPKGSGIYFTKQKNISLTAKEEKAAYYLLSMQAKDLRLIPIKDGFFMGTDVARLTKMHQELEAALKEENRFALEASVKLYTFFAELRTHITYLSLDALRQEAEKKCLPALEYIQKNASSDIELSLLASLCSYGITHFSRLFRIATGMTTKEYIRKLRMQTAVQILTDLPNITTREIAKTLGYEYRYFLILFRRTYGVTPDAYRKNNR